MQESWAVKEMMQIQAESSWWSLQACSRRGGQGTAQFCIPPHGCRQRGGAANPTPSQSSRTQLSKCAESRHLGSRTPLTHSARKAEPKISSRRAWEKYAVFHYLLVTVGIKGTRQERRAWPNSENSSHRKPPHFVSIKITNWVQRKILLPPATTLNFRLTSTRNVQISYWKIFNWRDTPPLLLFFPSVVAPGILPCFNQYSKILAHFFCC